jgi:hypothetical protein
LPRIESRKIVDCGFGDYCVQQAMKFIVIISAVLLEGRYLGNEKEEQLEPF